MRNSWQPTTKPGAKQATQPRHTGISPAETVAAVDIGVLGVTATDGATGEATGDTQGMAALQDGRAATGVAATSPRPGTISFVANSP